jgi:hypothetical protein
MASLVQLNQARNERTGAVTVSVWIKKTVNETTTTVRIDGCLYAEDLGELKKACRDVSGCLCLELPHLMNVDREGLAAILKMLDDGAQMGAVNPYINALMEAKLRARREGHDGKQGNDA